MSAPAVGTVIRITIPGPPRGKGRPRATVMSGKVRAFTDTKTRNYEGMVRQAGADAMAGRVPLDGPVSVIIAALLPIPGGWSGKRQREASAGTIKPAGHVGDIDNFLKSALDGLSGIVFRDDCQVVDALVSKRYSDRPQLQISIVPLDGASGTAA